MVEKKEGAGKRLLIKTYICQRICRMDLGVILRNCGHTMMQVTGLILIYILRQLRQVLRHIIWREKLVRKI